LNTAESSIGDVDGLHAKLDRKRSVESHNQQAQATFQQRFEQSLLSLTQGVNDLSDCYHTVSDTATQQLGKREFGCLVLGKVLHSSLITQRGFGCLVPANHRKMTCHSLPCVCFSDSSLKRQTACAQQLQGELSSVSSLVASRLRTLLDHQGQQSTRAQEGVTTLATGVHSAQVRLCAIGTFLTLVELGIQTSTFNNDNLNKNNNFI
jgi:kinesin family protein 11